MDLQHCKWFISGFLQHIIIPLKQQKVNTQVNFLEVAIRLEVTLGGEVTPRMEQVQTRIVELTMQLQNLSTTNPTQECIWFNFCIIEGHHKNEWPKMNNYMGNRSPIPFPPTHKPD